MVPLLICKLICSLVTGLLGFHTYGYARHFLSSCTHILSFPIIPDGVEFEGRLALVARAFPNGIDFFTSTEPHPLPTTTPPPPLTKLGRFLVHTILPTRNVVPHRRPDGHLALLPRQDHPPHGHGAERTTPRTQTGRPTREPHLSTPPAKPLLEAWIVSQGRRPTAASLTTPAPAQSPMALTRLATTRSSPTMSRAIATGTSRTIPSR
ncbi:hypothetical protein EDB83DRAFT_2381448 [Lactarius deliciosus]|nr:hypothetical protein EDB83DRAFT_2381448 [Lactarius deliciosus]